MADEQNSGWFRHRRSGQVFEAEGHQYREALKNRDLEAIDGPDEKSDDSPSAKLVALRERVSALGLDWAAGDSLDDLNAKLDTETTRLRAEAAQLGVKIMPNFRPETIAEKIQAARAERTKVEQPKGE